MFIFIVLFIIILFIYLLFISILYIIYFLNTWAELQHPDIPAFDSELRFMKTKLLLDNYLSV